MIRRMRKGRRNFKSAWGLALAGGPRRGRADRRRAGAAGPADPDDRRGRLGDPRRCPACPPPSGDRPVALGRALADRGADRRGRRLAGRPGRARRGPTGRGRLGSGPRGRVRARVEAPLGAELTVQVGRPGDPDPAGLAPRRPAADRARRRGVEVGVERLAWDAIQVDLGEPGGDGTVEPGAAVPLSVGFNVLTPEPAEVDLRCSAELRPVRGGEPVWRQRVAARWSPPTRSSPPAHAADGRRPRGPRGRTSWRSETTWEPLADPAGTRLGPVGPAPAEPVADDLGDPPADAGGRRPRSRPPRRRPPRRDGGRAWRSTRSTWPGPGGIGRRPRAGRRWPAPGRSAWRSPRRRWSRPRSATGSGAGSTGTAPSRRPWPRPTRRAGLVGRRPPGRRTPSGPHRLTVTVAGGHPARWAWRWWPAAGRAAAAGSCSTPAPRARRSSTAGPPATFSWLVWPDAGRPGPGPGQPRPVGAGAGRRRSRSTELADLPARRRPARTPSARWACTWPASGRSTGSAAGRRLGPGRPAGRRPGTWRRYLAYCGASTVVLPDGLADRAPPAGPRRPGRRGRDRPRPARPAPPGPGPPRAVGLGRRRLRRPPARPARRPTRPRRRPRGLVRVDRRGPADGPSYHPLHPEVREAMARQVAEAVAPRQGPARTSPGVLIRLGPGPTLLGGPDTGLDDATFARFVRGVRARPGRAGPRPGADRPRPVRGPGPVPRRAGPDALAGLAGRARSPRSTPSWPRPPRRAAPGRDAWRSSTPGLDTARPATRPGGSTSPGSARARPGGPSGSTWPTWPTGEGAPVVLRGVGLSHRRPRPRPGHQPRARRPGRRPARPGASCWASRRRDAEPRRGPAGPPRLTARPLAEGAPGDEPLGHALAALDARWVVAGRRRPSPARRSGSAGSPGSSRAAGPAAGGPPEPRLPSGVVGPADPVGGRHVPRRWPTTRPTRSCSRPSLDGPADGAGRRPRPGRPARARAGGRAAPGWSSTCPPSASPRSGSARPRSGSPRSRRYPGPAVLDGMKAQYDDLRAALARLEPAPGGRPGAPRPGPGRPTPGSSPTRSSWPPRGPRRPSPGWEVVGRRGGSAEIDRDRPHSGRGSLRLDARARPGGRRQRPVPPRRPVDPDDPRLAPRRPARRQGPGLDRGRVGGPAVRPAARRRRPGATGPRRPSGPPQLPAGGPRLGPAPVRAARRPGGLWVDDVSVAGERPERARAAQRPPRPDGRALQAYREKRYADFARLAGSHWARHVSGAPGPPARWPATAPG